MPLTPAPSDAERGGDAAPGSEAAASPIAPRIESKIGLSLSFNDRRAPQGRVLTATLSVTPPAGGDTGTAFDVAIDLPPGLDFVASGDKGVTYDPALRAVIMTGMDTGRASQRGRAFTVVVRDAPALSTLTPRVRVLTRADGQAFTIRTASLLVPGLAAATLDPRGGSIIVAGGAARLDFGPGALRSPQTIEASLTVFSPPASPSQKTDAAADDEEDSAETQQPFWTITLAPDLVFSAPVTLTTNISLLVDLDALVQREVILVMRYIYTAWVTRTLDTGMTIVRVEDVAEEMPIIVDEATGDVTALLHHFSTYDLAFAQPAAPKPWTPTANGPDVSLFRGAATYRHPFPALPAFGLEPKLAATYSSVSGEGDFLQTHEPGLRFELGRGWSLDIPRISQLVTRKLILGDPPNDGWRAGFDTEARGNFTLAMNGISVGLRPTGANGVYVTEDSQALRIVRCAKASPCAAQDQLPGIPLSGADWDSGALEYWQVWTPDGTRYVFGSDSASRSVVQDWDYDWCGNGTTAPGCGSQWNVPTPRHVGQVWMLRRVYSPDRDALSAGVDRWGAEYQYAFFNDDASYCNTYWSGTQIHCAQEPDQRVRPTAIVYGNSILGANNRYSVTFAYSGDKLTEVTAYGPGNLPAARARMSYGSACYHSVCDELNGITDEVYTGTVWTGLPGPSFTTSFVSNALDGTRYGEDKRLLTQVENGYGAAWTFTYEPETIRVLAGLHVKKRETRAQAGALPATEVYQYGSACLDWADEDGNPLYPCVDTTRAWAGGSNGRLSGYGVVTRTAQDESGTTLAIDAHRFHVDAQRLGREYEARYLDGSGIALRARQSDLVTATLSGYPATSWQVRTAETRDYTAGDVGSAPMKKTRTDSFTALGSPRAVQEYGFDPAGDERTTFIGYVAGPIAGELPVWEALYSGILTAEVDSPSRMGATRLYYDYAENGRANTALSGFNVFSQTPARGRLTAVEYGLGASAFAGAGSSAGQPALWSMANYGYNPLGNLAVLTDAGLYTSSVVYDPSGQFVLQALNPLGQATGYAYFGVNGVGLTNTNGVTQPFGALKSMTDPNGAMTLYDYDAFGRLITLGLPPVGGGPSDLSHWSTHYAYTTAYTSTAGLPRVQIVETICETEPCATHNRSSVSFYDGLGRVIQTRSPDGTGGQMRVVETLYDALGRVSLQTVPYTQATTQGVIDAPFVTAAELSNTMGGGVEAAYFSGTNFNTFVATRTVSTAGLAGTLVGPWPGVVGSENFSIRWTGMIRANTTETYTFYLGGDDAARLWIDGTFLDGWNKPAWTGSAMTIPLQAGQFYDLKLEYFNGCCYGGLGFAWSSPSIPKQAVPASALFRLLENQLVILPRIPSTRTAYDALGRPITVTAPDGTLSVARYGVDVNGPGYAGTNLALKTMIDPNGHQTQQVSDGLGRLIRVREFDGTDPYTLTAETRYAYDAADRLTTVTDTLSNVTQISYDALGRKVGMVDPDMGIWSYAYNALGQLTSQTDAKGQMMVFAYDALGRMTGKGARVTETTVYEAENAQNYHGTSPGYSVTVAGRGTAWVGSGYGALTYGPYLPPRLEGPGQAAVFRLAMASPGSSDSAIVASIDVNDATAGNERLALRDLKRYEFEGGSANYRDFALDFDTTGRLTHTFEYRVWLWNNEVISHDRTTLLWATPLATYAYDQGNNGIGRRSRMTDTTGYAAWAYDPRGRVITATKQIAPNPVAYATGFGYDAANRVIKTSYPGGDVVTNTYDAAGQPFSLYAAGSALVKSAAYNALGAPTRVSFASGLDKLNGYFGLDYFAPSPNWSPLFAYGKLRNTCVITAELACDTETPGALLNTVYWYDKAGNVTTVRDNVMNSKLTASYDALDRLISARTAPYTTALSEVAPLSETYSYNAIGNLTGRFGVSGTAQITYPAAGSARPHAALATASGNRYAYDANGNMTVRVEISGTEAFTYTQAWTVDNRLAAITKTDASGAELAVTWFYYDGDGVRVRKVDPDGTTLYVGPVEQTIGPGGTVTAEYFDDVSGSSLNSFFATRLDLVNIEAVNGFTLTPLPGMGSDSWGVRFQLYLTVAVTDSYKFGVFADDGFSFGGNGLTLSRYVTQSAAISETTSALTLTPGVVYNFGLAYLNYTSATTSVLQLLWRRGNGALELVPSASIHARGRRDYFSFAGAVVAMKEGVMSSATRTLTYLHGDHLGSASLTTNISGTLVSQQRYKPYGEVRWSSGAGMPTDLTFTGQRAGSANYVGSLTDYVARFYSPALGRFISADSIVPSTSRSSALNRFSYVIGNPLSMRDPTGHWFETVFDLVMAAWSFAEFAEEPNLENTASLVLDVAAVVVPIPAVGGLAIKGAKRVEKIANLVRVANRVDNVADGLRWVDRFAGASPDILNGVTRLENSLNSGKIPKFKHGLTKQLERAYDLFKQGKLKGVEVTESANRFDFVLIGDDIVEFKYWTAGSIKKYGDGLATQLMKYKEAGKKIRLELGQTRTDPIGAKELDDLVAALKAKGLDVDVTVVDFGP